MGAIVLENIIKKFGSVEVINDVCLDVADGEFVVFVGPSGCGKSTLLRIICGLEDLTDGVVRIDGKDVGHNAPAERQIAMVFQSYALYPHMSVRKNIGFGLKIAGFDKATVAEKVEQAASMLELTPLLDRKPRELSGGQRQRVAIGRAIVRSPTAFLFDEPLSNLDAALRVQMRMEIIRLHQSLGKTMIYVTHDQVEAMTMADRIAVLNGGRVEQFAAPVDLYDRPVNKFVAAFIGSPKMNFVNVQGSPDGLVMVNGETIRPSGFGPETMARAIELGIRPEHIRQAVEDPVWTGRILVSEQLGSDAYFHVEVEGLDTQLVVRAIDERRFKAGDTIGLSPDLTRCYLFAPDGKSLFPD